MLDTRQSQLGRSSTALVLGESEKTKPMPAFGRKLEATIPKSEKTALRRTHFYKTKPIASQRSEARNSNFEILSKNAKASIIMKNKPKLSSR